MHTYVRFGVEGHVFTVSAIFEIIALMTARKKEVSSG